MPPTAATTACARCGEPILAGAHFCPKCGMDISGAQGQLTTMNMPLAPSSAEMAAEQMLTLLREATLGEYEILGELGRGGMATVYLGHDIALDRKVAIKIMNPQTLMGEGMLDRFKREARTAASLSHAHIIPIYLVKETERILYFVMKFVQGRGLDSIIKEKGALPIRMAQAILTQVGGALGYAHRRGIIHRDIKPANIMIDDEGGAVVTDFGIAKVAEARGLTMTGATVGTPYYMSPEQCSAKTITGSSDQYSLGIVAYEMLTGKPPFAGETIMEIMRAHFFDPPAPLKTARPDCPPALATVIERMLAKEADKRWPKLEDAIAAMGAEALDHDDPIRTQMVELAKTGIALKQLPKYQTPTSPVPLGKRSQSRPDISSAPTTPLVSGRARPVSPAPKPAKRRGWLIALPLVAAAGVGGYLVLGTGGAPRGGGDPADTSQTIGAAPDTSARSTLPAGARPDSVSQTAPAVIAQVQVAPTTANVRVGDRLTLLAQVFDQQGRRMPQAAVTWSTNNSQVARVDNGGTVTGAAEGVAIITASAGGQKGVAAIQVASGQTAQRPAGPPPQQTPPQAAPQEAQPTGTGIVKLGTRGEAAVLYVNGTPQGTIAGLQDWTVPAGRVRLSIQATGCTPWDTTVTVGTGAEVRIGYRNPTCSD